MIGTVTLAQLHQLAGKNAASWRGERKRGQTACAFGQTEPIHNSPLLMDAVAIRIVDRLNGLGVSREEAATITRAYWGYWARGVSMIEHNGEHILIVVRHIAQTAAGEDRVVRCARPKDLPGIIAENFRVNRMFIVDLNEEIGAIRANARAADIDLSPVMFFLPTSHPQFQAWESEWLEWHAALRQHIADDKRTMKVSKKARSAIASNSLECAND